MLFPSFVTHITSWRDIFFSNFLYWFVERKILYKMCSTRFSYLTSRFFKNGLPLKKSSPKTMRVLENSCFLYEDYILWKSLKRQFCSARWAFSNEMWPVKNEWKWSYTRNTWKTLFWEFLRPSSRFQAYNSVKWGSASLKDFHNFSFLQGIEWDQKNNIFSDHVMIFLNGLVKFLFKRNEED
jgi:hypothetical protein